MIEKKQSLLREIIAEYKKVTWPKLPEIIQVTIVVLLITIFVSLMIMFFDISFKKIIEAMSKLIAKIIK